MISDAMDKECWTRLCGCFLSFASAVLYAVQGMFFKMIISLFYMETLLIRNLVIGVAVVTIALCRHDAIFPNREDVKWLTSTAFFSAVGMPCRYYAVVLLEFADVFALTLSGIMVSSLVLGRIFLKETCGVFEAVMCTTILAGMTLISDPRKVIMEIQNHENELEEMDDIDDEWTFFIPKRVCGLMLILGEITAATLIALSARKVPHIHFGVVLVHCMMWCAPVSLLMTVVLGQFTLPQSQNEWIYLVAFVLVGMSFNFTLFSAYSMVEAGTVSTIRTLEIAVSYLLQYLVLGVVPTVVVISGAVLVSLASFVFGFAACKRNGKVIDLDNEENKLLKTGESKGEANENNSEERKKLWYFCCRSSANPCC